MLNEIIDTKTTTGLFLFLMFGFLFNFSSFSKTHFLISKATYNVACSVSTDTHTHSDIDAKILEDIKHNTEAAVVLESIDSEIDVFEAENDCNFNHALLHFSMFSPFVTSSYEFISIDLHSPPPRN